MEIYFSYSFYQGCNDAKIQSHNIALICQSFIEYSIQLKIYTVWDIDFIKAILGLFHPFQYMKHEIYEHPHSISGLLWENVSTF